MVALALEEQAGQQPIANVPLVPSNVEDSATGSSSFGRKLGLRFDGWDALLLAIAWTHVVFAPYTKVEESFNVQAIHDILYHGTNLSKYDHFEFPGVVPRTFIGAIFVSAFASPAVAVIRLLHLPKLYALYLVRMVLAAVVACAFRVFRSAVEGEFGRPVGVALALVTTAQFHVLYYGSRPLPNTFALALAYVAYGLWISGRLLPALRTLVFAACVFRCDLVVLLGPIGLLLLITGELKFWRAFVCCAVAGVASLGLTVAVDSAMWRRLVWPEGAVLFFNTALNKSSEWGVSPFYWYFSSALPRALLGGLPLSLAGLWLDRRLLRYFVPVLGFVCLYSILPHKELRFVFVALPIFNLAAAATIARLYVNRRKRRLVFAGAVSILAGSLLVTVLSALVSYGNYPGGHALACLHSLGGGRGGSVHVGNLAAISGASRFCEEEDPSWRYSKEEGVGLAQYAEMGFDYLLSEHDAVPGFERVAAVPGFARLQLAPSAVRLRIVLKPKVFIHRAAGGGGAAAQLEAGGPS